MSEQNNALPKGWAYTNLADIVSKIANGFTQRQDKSGDIPVTRIETISKGVINLERVGYLSGLSDEILEKYKLQKGDILFSHINSDLHLGKTAVFNLDKLTLLHGMNLLLIRPDKEVVSAKFLNYLFNCYRFAGIFISIAQHAVNQSSINQSKLNNLRITLPPLSEQQRIVAKIEELFTKLDAGIEALKTARAQLGRYRQAVLKAAVTGELTREWCEAHRGELEPAADLLVRILEERRAKWERDQLAKMQAAGKLPKNDDWKKKYQEPAAPNTSELPELPDGWAWAAWEQIGFSQNGRSFPSGEYQDYGIKLLRPGNLHISGKVVWTPENTRHMPEKWAEEFPSFIIGSGELVMNLTAQSLRDEFLGRICITGDPERCLLNQRIARLTPVLVSASYLLCMFKSEVFRRFVDRLNTGSLIQHMFTSQLAEFALPLPPLAEQQQIVSEVERLLSIADAMEQTIEQSLKQAERLRQSILQQAFAGKLVPQDPNDEPASVLLERIKQERAARADGQPQKVRAQKRAKPRKAAAQQIELIKGATS